MRIPVYAAERRTLDAWGRVLARQDSFGFKPLDSTARVSEWGKVVRDAADSPRFLIVAPDSVHARVKRSGGEYLLCLYDEVGKLLDFWPPHDAVDAAERGLRGLSLAPLDPAPATAEGGGA